VLDVLIPDAELPEDIEEAVLNRIRMRLQRNFAESDKIRDQLALQGYQLEDTQSETVVIWSQGNKIVRL
jgi:cysteinyl-tRNA synthetase